MWASSQMKNSTIAYCGVPGSFSHTAAVLHFGKDNTFIGTLRFLDIFSLIEKGQAEYGVVSFENSQTGPIRENLDHLLNHGVYLVGDEYLCSVHNLLSVPSRGKTAEERLGDIHRVVSHHRAIEQCHTFFEAHPQIEPVVFSDTGRAAQLVADANDPSLAAIAGIEASRIYGLDVLCPSIQASSRNLTRFGFVARERQFDSNANKSSIICSLEHKPGSLLRILEVLAAGEFNVSFIEQRSLSEDLSDVGVFIDFEFPLNRNTEIELVFQELAKVVKSLRVVGVYRSRIADRMH